MNRLFGKAKAAGPVVPPPTLADASGKMDGRLQAIDTKIAGCDADIKKYMSQGRGAQQRQMAMQVMKRKKMYEQQRDQLMGTQFNVDSMAFAQEQAEVTAMSVEAMRAGQQELKASYAKMNIGDIEQLMDDMADFADEAKEINECISTAFAVPEGFDEASFEDEFTALEEEMKMESLAGLSQPAAAAPSYLAPAAPASAPSAATAAGYETALPPPSAPPPTDAHADQAAALLGR